MLYADLGDRDLGQKLRQLAPAPGYCICVDIAHSTALKERGLSDWVTAMLRTFECVRSCLYAKFPPIKALGDALMFYIPCHDLRGETAGTLLVACRDIVNEAADVEPTRVAGVLCEEAYPVSFMRGQVDYHGSDVDLAFRLLAMAGPREVVVDRRFFDAARRAYRAQPSTQSGDLLGGFFGPWPLAVRGLSGYREIYKYAAGTGGAGASA